MVGMERRNAPRDPTGETAGRDLKGRMRLSFRPGQTPWSRSNADAFVHGSIEVEKEISKTSCGIKGAQTPLPDAVHPPFLGTKNTSGYSRMERMVGDSLEAVNRCTRWCEKRKRRLRSDMVKTAPRILRKQPSQPIHPQEKSRHCRREFQLRAIKKRRK